MVEDIKNLPLKKICVCLCAEGGPCAHKWDGPFKYFDRKGQVTEDKKLATMASATCLFCNELAINHDMRRG